MFPEHFRPQSSDRETADLVLAQSHRVFKWGRAYVVLILLGMLAMLGRVVQLKVAPDPRLRPAVGTPLSTRVEVTRRGDLLDRVGRVIATSTIGYRLFVDPKTVGDLSTIAIDLGNLIKRDPIAIDRTITQRPDSRYVVIEQQLDDWQVDAVRKANLKGVGLEPRLVRHYPHNDLAAGIVGKVGFDHAGQGGFEHIFNRDMLPEPGKLVFLRDVHRQALWIDPNDYDPGHNGQDVRLSIDLVIQEIAEKRLRRAVEEHNAGGGRMVVADCWTGEILAMCDVLNPRSGWAEQTEDPLRKLHPALGRNRCVTDPYEPGSTFKPFIWSVATELGKADPDELLPTPDGPWRTPYGRVIRDAHYYGPSTWRKVLVKSMNSGMAMVAERMSHREMQDAVRRFGFGAKTNCGLTGETAGIVTSPKNWKTYTQSSVAIGQEIAVTPLQMVRAFCALARDGTMPQLRITAGDPTLGAPVGQMAPSRALNPHTVAITREAMKGVVEEGTGRAAQSGKYQLFAKSGTAQLPKRNGKGYWQDRYVSSFIAGAPYEQPRIVVLCVIDDPDRRKGHFGGAIAGPVVRDVVDETLTYLGVMPDLPEKQFAQTE
jgi:cell division protein FtsI (penicillin-binding protein 3)